MNSVVLFSGGKDSTLALYKALENGDNVQYLLSMESKNSSSYMFHVPNISLTDLIAEAINIPHIKGKTNGIKEDELEDLKRELTFLKKRVLNVYILEHYIPIIKNLE